MHIICGAVHGAEIWFRNVVEALKRLNNMSSVAECCCELVKPCMALRGVCHLSHSLRSCDK